MTMPSAASAWRSSCQRRSCSVISSWATARMRQLFGRGEPVLADLGHPFADLAGKPCHPDHEELVEVVGRDRVETQTLEQRMAGIARFLQHPKIEAEPRQLAIDEARRAFRVDGRHRGHRSRTRRAGLGQLALQIVKVQSSCLSS
jgi:hypothetical protein